MHWSRASSPTSSPAARSHQRNSSASNTSSTSNAKPSSPYAANAKPRSASPTRSRPESPFEISVGTAPDNFRKHGITNVYPHAGRRHFRHYHSEFDFRYNVANSKSGERSFLAT